MPITGNKGEWSEAYVLLKLLGIGKLYAADNNLNRIDNMFFPILNVIREETQGEIKEFHIDHNDRVVKIFVNDEFFVEYPCYQFNEEAQYLYAKIVEGGNRAFAITRSENFIKSIGCNRLAAPSTDKTDITLQIHDINTGYEPICGFSIKSEIGNSPTLINATGATNFIYEVKGLSQDQITDINAIETSTKIKDRMERIFSEAEKVEFVKVNSSMFTNNLTMIDSRLAEIVAQSLIYHYRDGLTSCLDVVNKLESENPLNYPADGFYLHKFKEFLCFAALGMTPAKLWDGRDEANGGYIIVTSNGDVLAYHIYNRDFFKDYLMNNTKYERASTSRHGYASLYQEDGKTYLKLNLQIRFI